jgi:hypothetical protein
MAKARTRTAVSGVAILSLLLAVGCARTTSPSRSAPAPARPAGPVKLSFDFSKGALGWEADFSDYAVSLTGMQLVAGLRPLPPDLKTTGTGFFIQGNNNHNYDLFMYLKRRLGLGDGIKENQAYLVTYRMVFASNAGSNCLGVIGAPGESVFLKAGASSAMPVVTLRNGQYRLNIDKGEVNLSGKHASLVGTIANGLQCKDFPSPDLVPYVSLKRVHKHPVPVKTNDRGEFWLLVGSDSAYESVTGLYYQRIDVELEPISSKAVPVSHALP